MLVTDGLVVEREGAVVWCVLDRPPLNVLEPGLIGALGETFAELARDRSVRAAVLTGHGRAFTAGMDVRVLGAQDVAGAKRLITALHAAIEAVHHAPFPVIAALNGACLGAGLELALACDLRVAVTAARLGLPEVRVGVPSVIEAALLPLLVGPGRAAELLLSGEAIAAAQALEWGLVNRVVPRAKLDEAVGELVEQLLDKFFECTRYTRAQVNFWKELAWHQTVGHARDWLTTHFACGEPNEGMRAFVEKRPVDYRGLRRKMAEGGNIEFLWGAYSEICPACGADGLPSEFAFCGKCGQALNKPSA